MTPRLRTLFVGLDSFWPRILAEGLEARYPEEFSCRRIVQGAGVASIPAFISAVHGADLVVRVGGTFRWDSRLDSYLLTRPRSRRHTPVIVYWTGTDVLMLQRSSEAGTLPDDARRLLAGVRHIAGAEHLTAELAEVGVSAVTVPFPGMALSPPESAPELPERFRVLTYLPEGSGERFAFYGGPQMLEAARALPDVEFDVMGAATLDVPVPDNVTLLGRVQDPEPVYRDATVVVRMVEHDAIGGTVCEGLMYGRHVIYTYDVPHTTKVPFGDSAALIDTIRVLHERHSREELGLNAEGFSYAQTEFDPDLRFARLREVLLDVDR